MDPDFVPEGIDLERPNMARIYDWALGGSASWAVDRAYGERAVRAFPLVRTLAKANRDFLGRVVRYCIENGVNQFLDLGSGVPTVGNVHEIADDVDDESRCVYVDNEAVAVAHARILLDEQGDPDRHAVLHADLRRIDDVWLGAMASGVLDPDRPIALLSVAVLHFLLDTTATAEVLHKYQSLLVPGSLYALSHATESGVEGGELDQVRQLGELSAQSSTPFVARSTAEITGFFGDFALVEPGLVPVGRWHGHDLDAGASLASVVGGVGRKPGTRR